MASIERVIPHTYKQSEALDTDEPSDCDNGNHHYPRDPFRLSVHRITLYRTMRETDPHGFG